VETFAQKFSKILAEQGFITSEAAASISRDFKTRSKESLVYFLIDEGLVPRNEILKALSRYFNLPSFDSVGYLFDHDLVGSFPKDFLISNGLIPMSLQDDILVVVASDPDQSGLASRVMQFTDANVEFVVGIKRDIWDAIQEFSDKSLTDPEYIEEKETGEDESAVDEESL
jgi:hypothetical protein